MRHAAKKITLSVRSNLYLNLLNIAFFLGVALTGSLIQIEYHMHRLPDDYLLMGLGKSGWLLLHQAAAVAFLAGLIIHCALNWRFISAATRRIFRRKPTPFASLSYWLFLIYIPTCLTAMASWILFSASDRGRLVLVESHDKLGVLVIVLSVIHIIMRAGKMTKAYRTLGRQGNKSGRDRA